MKSDPSATTRRPLHNRGVDFLRGLLEWVARYEFGRVGKLLLATLVVWVFGAIGISYFEKDSDPEITAALQDLPFPNGVPESIADYIEYDADKHLLVSTTDLQHHEHKAACELSTDPAWQQAMDELLMEAENLQAEGTAHLDHFFEAGWGMLVYLFSGFENYVPHTTGGKTVAVIALVFGVALVAAITATFAAILVSVGQSRGFIRKLPPQLVLGNHILICGWNPRGVHVLAHLRGEEGDLRTPIIVVAPESTRIRVTNPRTFRRVYALDGDPVDPAVIGRAHADTAESAIILAQDTVLDAAHAPEVPPLRATVTLNDPDHPTIAVTSAPEPSIARGRDVHTLLVAMALKHHGERLHVCAELSDMDRKRFFEYAGVDEAIPIGDVGTKLLAQAAINPGVTDVFDQLLSLSRDSCEVYRVPVPEAFIGRTFQSLMSALIETKEHDVTLLGLDIPGIGRGGRRSLLLNPRHTESRTKTSTIVFGHVVPLMAHTRQTRLTRDDRLICVAYTFPDLSTLTPTGGEDRKPL